MDMSMQESPQCGKSDLDSFGVEDLVENMDPTDGWRSYVGSDSETGEPTSVGITLRVSDDQIGDLVPLFYSSVSEELMQAEILADGLCDALNAGMPMSTAETVLRAAMDQAPAPLKLQGYTLVDSYQADGHRVTAFLRAETDDVLIRDGFFNIDSGSAKEWLKEQKSQMADLLDSGDGLDELDSGAVLEA